MAPSRVTRYLGLFWLLVPLLGCADDVELLSTSSPDFHGFPTPKAGIGGATEASGGVAAFGNAGDPGVAGDTSYGGSPAAGSGGYAGGGVAGSCGGGCGACTDDLACAYGSEWCVQGVCTSCSAAPDPCPPGWNAVGLRRNGCIGLECVPPTACRSASDCGGGATCYAGALCPEGCAQGDPSCCFGNFCARPGCDPAAVPLTCSQRGCVLGKWCAGPDWATPDCDCDGSTWSCVTPQSPSECI